MWTTCSAGIQGSCAREISFRIYVLYVCMRALVLWVAGVTAQAQPKHCVRWNMRPYNNTEMAHDNMQYRGKTHRCTTNACVHMTNTSLIQFQFSRLFIIITFLLNFTLPATISVWVHHYSEWWVKTSLVQIQAWIKSIRAECEIYFVGNQ